MSLKVSKTENKEEPVIDALGTVKDYLNIYKNVDLIEEVYHLMGGHKYSDSATSYQYASVDLLASLSDPEISTLIKKRMGGYVYEHLIKMLTRMWTFCKVMNDEAYEAILTAYMLENDNTLSLEAEARIEKEYRSKLELHNKTKAA